MRRTYTGPKARKRFPLLLNDDEKRRYWAAAVKAKRSLGDWIRVTCDEALAREGK